jgi:DNA replication and repair protein RecF
LLDGRRSQFASEGQQRSMAIALKLGQARLLEAKARAGHPPLLLMDDIFGELDLPRRNALLGHLPAAAQQLITTTHIEWMSGITPGRVHRVDHGRVSLFDEGRGGAWQAT